MGKTASRNLESQDLDHSLTNMPNYSVEKGFKQLGTKIYKCDGLNFFSIKKKNIPQRLERGSANSGAEPLPLDQPLLCCDTYRYVYVKIRGAGHHLVGKMYLQERLKCFKQCLLEVNKNMLRSRRASDSKKILKSGQSSLVGFFAIFLVFLPFLSMHTRQPGKPF